MESKIISLSSRGLKTACNLNSKSFTFCVGEQKYYCDRFAADFISPNVSLLHKMDPTMDSFEINIEDKDGTFQEIIKLMRGDVISIDSMKIGIMLKFARILGNQELEQMIEEMDELQTDLVNCVDILIEKNSIKENVEKEISFIAQHFFEIDKSKLRKLDSLLLYQIINCSEIQLSNEDELFDFVYSCFLNDRSFLSFFEFVKFEYLTAEKVTQFVKEINFTELNIGIWNSLCKRLCDNSVQFVPSETDGNSRFINNKINLQINKNDPFEGIIQYLNNQCGGNSHEKGVIEVTASSTACNSCVGVIDKNWGSNWLSNDDSDSWWMVDFKSNEVAINGYSIKTYDYGAGRQHLRTWRLEGSNDGKEWFSIDEQRDNDQLNGSNFFATWECETSQPFRFVRIRQTGENHCGMHYFSLSGVEFFGSLTRK
ncbi:hypothetical protein TRFO_11888 [Tritrichomonas foetus]|uniref:F5/8 type C domain-containing protein n=1 Tax=Tritrichomonas foetus TaxID=1144522 RepID=A0A1J4J754_9EUKA|nr:hypothetical protein TRFO_11888 [Tritrichomonas foetus]|eukprot:OHS93277.1 hypothetical protein TRFO_11888 [Tritrichomonas foetus]